MARRGRKSQPVPEWHCPVAVETIGDTPLARIVEASAEECSDVARRLGILGLESLRADVVLTRKKGGSAIHVTGRLYARAVQECVVSLESCVTDIDAEIEGWFADDCGPVSFARAKKDRQARSSQAEIELMVEEDDPDAAVDGEIDIGELGVQHLSLALPAYPRKEGLPAAEDMGEADSGEASAPLRKNPFEALKIWKEKR